MTKSYMHTPAVHILSYLELFDINILSVEVIWLMGG